VDREHLMTKVLKVVGPLATPYQEDGSRANHYEGAEWPEGAFREGETERFKDLGLIAEVEQSADDSPKSTARKSSK
jgi:hypothetical protein